MIKDLFDLRLNPHHIFGDVTGKDLASQLLRGGEGIRILGCWDPFETAVCIILGQVVSVEQARQKIEKLIRVCGKEVRDYTHLGFSRLFPTPEAIATADLTSVGLTKVRAQALKAFSKLVAEKKIDLTRTGDLTKTREQLLEIHGFGPWTVEMIAMRCLGDTNALPKNDLIIQRALKVASLKKKDWSPWNAYVALSLWKDHGRKKDVLLKKNK